ncbi:MAG: hypothetical protein HY741_09045 [Chloroflexi bacterium]|nr:hypothetical protein [Chloroflexota bacterium]
MSFVEHFYHSALTPVLVKPGRTQVLPLPPEFIVPQDGQEKQDCERVATQRWLAQHHAHFPPHTLTYLGDDLYANQPVCELIVETYHQSFLFVCKPDSHASLYARVALLEPNGGVEKVTKRCWNGKHHKRWSYRLVNQVPMRSGADALLVNWCELVITQEVTGEILYQNSFVTNHPLRRENVAVIVQAGRTRWKACPERSEGSRTKITIPLHDPVLDLELLSCHALGLQRDLCAQSLQTLQSPLFEVQYAEVSPAKNQPAPQQSAVRLENCARCANRACATSA